MTVEAIREDRPIPLEIWEGYGKPWKGIAGRFFRLLGAEIPYAGFEKIGVYQRSWETTKSLLPECPGGKVLELGCGTGQPLRDTLEITKARRILAIDNASSMLAAAQRRINRELSHRAGDISLVKMDIGSPWDPEKVDMTPRDLVLAHITFCFLTPRQREVAFAELSPRLKRDGHAVISLRTDKWTQERVKAHIREELRRDWKACLMALGAKRYPDQIEALIQSGEIDAKRPTREAIIALAEQNGLRIVEERGTFWPNDPQGAAGLAFLFQKT